mgnify:CR=1 FL=1
MKIAVMDDYQDAFRKTKAAAKLQGHEIISYTSSEKDPAKFGARAAGCEVIVLTQQRSFLPRPMIEALPASVKLLAQTGRNVPHIDTAACTERGIIVSASGGGRLAEIEGDPSVFIARLIADQANLSANCDAALSAAI